MAYKTINNETGFIEYHRTPKESSIVELRDENIELKEENREIRKRLEEIEKMLAKE